MIEIVIYCPALHNSCGVCVHGKVGMASQVRMIRSPLDRELNTPSACKLINAISKIEWTF